MILLLHRVAQRKAQSYTEFFLKTSEEGIYAGVYFHCVFVPWRGPSLFSFVDFVV